MRAFIESVLKVESVEREVGNTELVTATNPDPPILGRQCPVKSVTFHANIGTFSINAPVNVKVEVE